MNCMGEGEEEEGGRERNREREYVLCSIKQGTIHQKGQLVDTQSDNDSFNGLNSRQHVRPCFIAFHIGNTSNIFLKLC